MYAKVVKKYGTDKKRIGKILSFSYDYTGLSITKGLILSV